MSHLVSVLTDKKTTNIIIHFQKWNDWHISIWFPTEQDQRQCVAGAGIVDAFSKLAPIKC